ncbi:MAG TPA: tetratricopeptide repeat protein [bacterium]|nr:tetratricopeptide repeat protein [bacterium]
MKSLFFIFVFGLSGLVSAQSLPVTLWLDVQIQEPLASDSNAWTARALHRSLVPALDKSSYFKIHPSANGAPEYYDGVIRVVCGYEKNELRFQMTVRDTLHSLQKDFSYKTKPGQVRATHEKMMTDIFSSFNIADKKALETVKKDLQNIRSDEAYTMLQQAFAAWSDTRTADSWIQKALQKEPRASLLYERAGELAAARNEYDAAISYYQKTLELDSARFYIYRKIADVHYDHKNNLKSAKANYFEATHRDPTDAASWLQLGYCAYLEKDYTIARNYANKAVEVWQKKFGKTVYRETATAWNLIGNVAVAERDTAGAREYFEKATNTNPYDIMARKNLARLYEFDRRWDKAVSMYGQVLTLESQDITARLSLANLMYQKKRYVDAARYYVSAVMIKPESENQRENPIQILQWMSANRKDIKPLQTLMDSVDERILDDATDPKKQFELRITSGYVYLYYLQKPIEAIHEFKSAQSLNPRAYRLDYYLGEAYFQVGSYDLALPFLRRYAEHAEDSYTYAKVFLLLAKTLNKLKRYEEAQIEIIKSIRVYPNAESYYVQGIAFRGTQNNEEAVRAFERAVKVFPNYTQAHYELGRAHMALRKYDKALPELQKAVELDSSNYPYRQTLARWYSTLERWEEADASLAATERRMLSAGVKDPTVYEDWGEQYFQQKKYDVAAQKYTLAYGADTTTIQACFRLASIAASQHDGTSALRWLSRAFRNRFVDFNALLKDKNFNALRQTPEYVELVGAYERAYNEEVQKKINLTR